jgi:hypothetical protein
MGRILIRSENTDIIFTCVVIILCELKRGGLLCCELPRGRDCRVLDLSNVHVFSKQYRV